MTHILLIEDDKITAAMVEKFLTNGGHVVTVHNDGKAGLKSALSNPPDIVITDVYMPETDGLEAIRELRAQNPQMPIIAMSGGGTGASGAEILKIAQILGAREVLRKPVTQEEVLGAITKCLER